MQHRNTQFAFSLVELSIVLVILGLLTGGILAGQSLIRAAEVRTVSTEQARYMTAINTFRDKYFALPGDFSQATKFWTAAGGNGSDPACRTAALTSTTGTCDGNGSGGLDNAVIWETATIWTHLARAGLIEGQYIYFASTSPTLGTNIPASKLPNAGWSACNTSFGGYTGGNVDLLVLGSPGHSSTTCAVGLSPGLKAEEAWGIDTKLDDGRATYGRVTATNSYDVTSGCVTHGFTTEVVGDDYVLNNSAKACRLNFRM